MWRLPRVFLLAAVLICLASRLLTLNVQVLNVDEASYAAAAVRALATDSPIMQNSRDNKPPGIYAVYASVFKLAGPYNMAAVRWVALVWVLSTAALLYACGLKLRGEGFASLAAGFYLLATSLDLRFIAFKTEIMMNLAVAMSLWLLLAARESRQPLAWWLLAGAAGGLALMFRQPGAAILAAMLAAFALHTACNGSARLALVQIASYAAGAVALLAAVALYFRAVGALDEVVYQTFGLPYEFSTFERYSLGARLVRLVTYLEEYFRFAQILFAAGLIGVALALTRLIADWRRKREFSDLNAGLIVLSFPASVLAFAAAPDMFHAYFIQLFVPLALAFALAVELALSAGKAMARPSAAPTAWLCAAAITLGSAAVVSLKDPVKLRMGASDQLSPLEPLVESLKRHQVAGDRLYVWGFRPQLYVATGMAPATRFTLTDILIGLSGEVGRREDPGSAHPYYEPQGWDKFMAELEAEKPKFIIDTGYMAMIGGKRQLDTFPRLAAYVSRHYARLEGLPGSAIVYMRLPKDQDRP